MASNLSALDRLRKAANLEPVKKEVELSDGSIFEMYVSPLTMAERERAQRQAKSDDANAEFLINFLLDLFDEAIVFNLNMNLIKIRILSIFFEPFFNS